MLGSVRRYAGHDEQEWLKRAQHANVSAFAPKAGKKSSKGLQFGAMADRSVQEDLQSSEKVGGMLHNKAMPFSRWST